MGNEWVKLADKKHLTPTFYWIYPRYQSYIKPHSIVIKASICTPGHNGLYDYTDHALLRRTFKALGNCLF